MTSGSDHEPSAAEQMRAATESLRDQAWMIATLTSGVIEPEDQDSATSV